MPLSASYPLLHRISEYGADPAPGTRRDRVGAAWGAPACRRRCWKGTPWNAGTLEGPTGVRLDRTEERTCIRGRTDHARLLIILYMAGLFAAFPSIDTWSIVPSNSSLRHSSVFFPLPYPGKRKNTGWIIKNLVLSHQIKLQGCFSHAGRVNVFVWALFFALSTQPMPVLK
jgi:hypothetical protein